MVKSHGGERCGQGAQPVRQVRTKKANVIEPLMTYRKRIDEAETGELSLLRDEHGGNLPTAHVASGMKVARAWFRLLCGTREPAPRYCDQAALVTKGDPQAAETARGRVPRRCAGADRPVVARKPGNAGGAKGAGYPGLFGGQPQGRSR